MEQAATPCWLFIIYPTKKTKKQNTPQDQPSQLLTHSDSLLCYSVFSAAEQLHTRPASRTFPLPCKERHNAVLFPCCTCENWMEKYCHLLRQRCAFVRWIYMYVHTLLRVHRRKKDTGWNSPMASKWPFWLMMQKSLSSHHETEHTKTA